MHIENEAGQTLISGLASDITERKQTEEALREEKNKFKLLTEVSPSGIWQTELMGNNTYVSQRWSELTGISPKDALGSGWSQRIHADDKEETTNGWLLAAQSAAPYRSEFRFVKPDGEVVWVLCIAQKIIHPVGIGNVSWIGTITDITAHKCIEMELRESEERLSSAARAAKFGFYAYDFVSGQAYYSLEFMDIYELPPGSHLELDEDLILKALHPDDRSGFLAQMQAANDPCGSGILDYTYRTIHPDGQVRWLRVSGQTTFSGRQSHDHPLRANGIIQDITEGKNIAEKQRNWEHQRLQLQKIESLNTMAGAIAHHFNNQLGAVIGNLEMALEDLQGDVAPVKILTDAMKAARKAAEVGGHMLTYLGQTTGTQAPLDLSETCRHSLVLLQTAVPQGLNLTVDFLTPGPTVNANSNQIQQILTNLVANSREAVAENKGTVCLTVKMASPAEIAAANRFPNDWQSQEGIPYACLEVADTGCGIAGEDIDKIFDPFFSSKFTGRGLGLSVVLGIVKAHHGAITVESQLEHGCCFRVLLPVSAEELPQQFITIQPLAEQGSGTVLLVDDEEILREMAAARLTRLGYTVIETKNGHEAMEMFSLHQEDICCVLTDLTMPYMDGWEVLAAVRKLSPDMPVIVSSGYDEAKVKMMFSDPLERPVVFLHKPYQKAELQAAMAEAGAS